MLKIFKPTQFRIGVIFSDKHQIVIWFFGFIGIAWIRTVLPLVLCLFIHNAFASDDWLCKEASSQRKGDQIFSCGVATAASENSARYNAFENAKLEFNQVCKASEDCRGHKYSTDPKRTSCDQVADGFKCYRLLVFTISPDMMTEKETMVAEQESKDYRLECYPNCNSHDKSGCWLPGAMYAVNHNCRE